jgi:hypothetical protein
MPALREGALSSHFLDITLGAHKYTQIGMTSQNGMIGSGTTPFRRLPAPVTKLWDALLSPTPRAEAMEGENEWELSRV